MADAIETPVNGETGSAVELAQRVQTPEAPILGDLPTVPEQNELQAMYQLANVFAASSLVPKDLRQQPNNCLLVMMTARELGVSFTVAFRECHVIDGKVTASPKLRSAIVRARGLGRIWPDPDNDEHSATWYGRRSDDPDTVYKSTFAWKDAQRPDGRSRLVGQSCTPDQHQTNRDGKCGCKDNWRNYPHRQLSWRAQGALLDDAFSEVATGLYDPDQLGAVTDEAGRPVIDVTEVQVPEGMHAPREQRRTQRQQSSGPGPADPKDLQALSERIKALPDTAREALRERWTQPRSAEAGGGPMFPVDAEGRPSVNLLNERTVRSVSALVASIERDVDAGKYGTPADPAPTPAEQPGPEEQAEPRQGIKPSQRQMARLHALLKDKRNAVQPDDRHAVLSEFAGREIGSASELSASEVDRINDQLTDEEDWGEPV